MTRGPSSAPMHCATARRAVGRDVANPAVAGKWMPSPRRRGGACAPRPYVCRRGFSSGLPIGNAAFKHCVKSIGVALVAPPRGGGGLGNIFGLPRGQRATGKLRCERRIKLAAKTAQHIDQIANLLHAGGKAGSFGVFALLLLALPFGPLCFAARIALGKLVGGQAVAERFGRNANALGAIGADETLGAVLVADHDMVANAHAALRASASASGSASHCRRVCGGIVLGQGSVRQTEEADDASGGKGGFCVHDATITPRIESVNTFFKIFLGGYLQSKTGDQGYFGEAAA